MIMERSRWLWRHLEGEGETDQIPLQLSKVQGRVQDLCEVSSLHSGVDGAHVQWNRRCAHSALEGKDDLCLEHAQCTVPLGHLGGVTD